VGFVDLAGLSVTSHDVELPTRLSMRPCMPAARSVPIISNDIPFVCGEF